MDTSDYIFFLVLFLIVLLIIYKFAAMLYTSLIVSTSVALRPSNALKILNDTDHILNEELLSPPLDNENGRISFRVLCASERSLSKFMNLFPWESKGVLSFDETNIHFIGIRSRKIFLRKTDSTVKVRYKFPRNQVKISFIPSNFLRDGGFEWVKMEAHKHKFYFTSGHQTRIGMRAKDFSTFDIYDLVTDVYLP